MVRLVVFLKNGKMLCWKLPIESLQLAQKYSNDGEEKQEKTCNFLDVSFIFVFSWSNGGISPAGFVSSFF